MAGFIPAIHVFLPSPFDAVPGQAQVLPIIDLSNSSRFVEDTASPSRCEFARVDPAMFAPSVDKRAQGMPGAGRARSLACETKKHTSKSPQVAGNARHSPRDG